MTSVTENADTYRALVKVVRDFKTPTATTTASTGFVPPTTFEAYFKKLDDFYKKIIKSVTTNYPVCHSPTVNWAACENLVWGTDNLYIIEQGYTAGKEALLANLDVLGKAIKQADQDAATLQPRIDRMAAKLEGLTNDASAARGMLGDRHTLYNQYMAHLLIIVLVIVACVFLYFYNDNPQLNDLQSNNWLFVTVGLSSVMIVWYTVLWVTRYVKSFF